MPSIADEIQQHRAQLKDFLGRKYVDQSILLGFINVLQSKYQAWILADLSGYYDEIESQQGNVDIEFNTIKFFDTLWQDFHYPIIKFFQFHHANLYNQTLSDFNKHQKSNSGNFRVKPVEMRKINDNFVKFIKQVNSFYNTLLKYFSTHFQNQLLPNAFLSHFNYTVPNSAIMTSSPNLQANIVFLIHRCLLSLGDLSRHSTLIELSYVKPCVSNREFFKYRSFNSKEKCAFMKPYYDKSLRYYKFCILLLPALNEPYNHIGMIHNLIDEKFDACYWFLRSQFTRIPNYGLGLANFNAVVKKNWFLTNLVDIKFQESEPKKKQKDMFSKEEKLNIMLVCLIGFFYCPETYRRGSNIVKNLKFTNIENDFFKLAFDSFDLLDMEISVDLNFFVKQLVFLFSTLKLIEQRKTGSEVFWKFEKFVFRYIGKFFEFSASFKGTGAGEQNALICFRLILNWLKENKSYLKTFNSSDYIIDNFVKLLNGLISKVDNPTQLEVINHILESNSRPLRSYYFTEDVYFRDFSLIKFQFKDFKDDHLFNSNNIDLLLGDFIDFYQNPDLDTASLSTDEIALKDIISKLNLEKTKSQPQNSFELITSENKSRLKAVLLLGKKCLEGKNLGVSYNFESNKFEFNTRNVDQNRTIKVADATVKEESPVPNTNREAKLEKKEKKLVVQEEKEDEIEPEVVIYNSASKEDLSQVPDSLEEIESYILHHTTKLQDEMMKSLDKETPEPEVIPKKPKENGSLNEIESFIKQHSNNLKKSMENEDEVDSSSPGNSSTTTSVNNMTLSSDNKNMMPINSNRQNFNGSYNIWNDQPYKQQFTNVLPTPSFYQNQATASHTQFQPAYAQLQSYSYPASVAPQYHQVVPPSAHDANGFMNNPPSVVPPVAASMGPYGAPNVQSIPQYPPNSAVVMDQGQNGTFHYPQYTAMNGAQVPIPPSAPHAAQYNQNTFKPDPTNKKFPRYQS